MYLIYILYISYIYIIIIYAHKLILQNIDFEEFRCYLNYFC